jgi:hypothetical protein
MEHFELVLSDARRNYSMATVNQHDSEMERTIPPGSSDSLKVVRASKPPWLKARSRLRRLSTCLLFHSEIVLLVINTLSFASSIVS